MLSALALQLAVLGLAVMMMQSALRRRPGGGLFAALPFGLIPPLLMSAIFFVQVHGAASPEMLTLRADWMGRWSELLPSPGEDAALAEAVKAEFMALGRQVFGAMPAFYFGFQAAALAAIAAWLRKRQARLGSAPKPMALAQWTAPLGLVWLVLGPVFWFFGGKQGVLTGPPWASALALNVLIIGLALYLFQGAVILGAKLVAWSRDPSTRALTPLVLGAVILSLVLLNGQGLVVFLILTGLFDPWIDLRRLQAKPEDGKAAS